MAVQSRKGWTKSGLQGDGTLLTRVSPRGCLSRSRNETHRETLQPLFTNDHVRWQWVRGALGGWLELVEESAECLAPTPEEECSEQTDEDIHGVNECRSLGEKDVEAEDIDDDWAEHEQSEIAGFRNGDEHPADDFHHFHECEVAGGVEGTHEHGGWSAFRGCWNRDEFQKEIESEDDEEKAK